MIFNLNDNKGFAELYDRPIKQTGGANRGRIGLLNGPPVGIVCRSWDAHKNLTRPKGYAVWLTINLSLTYENKVFHARSIHDAADITGYGTE